MGNDNYPFNPTEETIHKKNLQVEELEEEHKNTKLKVKKELKEYDVSLSNAKSYYTEVQNQLDSKTRELKSLI